MDQVGLLPYETLEAYHAYLFALMMKPIPETHFPITLSQILAADKHIWAFMGEDCRDGITARPNGSLPIAASLIKAMADPIILSLLSPLPRPATGKRPASDLEVPVNVGGKGRGRGGSAKGAGKGRGKKGEKGGDAGKGAKRSKTMMPKPLIGMHSTTENGDRLCFSANLACGCSDAAWGKKCGKGLHGCCKCLALTHGAHTCPN